MKGLIILFVTLAVFSAATGQNATESCSQDDLAELTRLGNELLACDPCEVEDPESCKCCMLYKSVDDLMSQCAGSINKRDINTSELQILLEILIQFCEYVRNSDATTMTAGITGIVLTSVAATML